MLLYHIALEKVKGEGGKILLIKFAFWNEHLKFF